MRVLTTLLPLSFAASVLGQDDPAPQPAVASIEYWGSACPQGGLSAEIGAVDDATNIAPFTFTLSNYLPKLGDFGSTLRMCNIVSHISVGKGWKVTLNARGTTAQGNADLPGNATMYLRGTYAFVEQGDLIQSIGMVDARGPLNGQFEKLITPVDGDKGIVSPCEGGELDIEFQARAVQDLVSRRRRRQAGNESSWTLTTDVQVSRC